MNVVFSPQVKNGRRMKERENKQYSVQLDPEVVKKIDYYAKKYDIARGKLMRNLIVIGLDDMNILHKAGILKAAHFTDKVVTTIKNLINSEKIYVGKDGKLKIETKKTGKLWHRHKLHLADQIRKEERLSSHKAWKELIDN